MVNIQVCVRSVLQKVQENGMRNIKMIQVGKKEELNMPWTTMKDFQQNTGMIKLQAEEEIGDLSCEQKFINCSEINVPCVPLQTREFSRSITLLVEGSKKLKPSETKAGIPILNMSWIQSKTVKKNTDSCALIAINSRLGKESILNRFSIELPLNKLKLK